MGRRGQGEGLIGLSRSFAITVRRTSLARHLYKIDHSDPGHVVVHVADDLTPSQESRAEAAIEADLDILARQRRRAGLAPAAELVRDEVGEPTGTEGDDVEREALARRASLRTVN